LAIFISFTKKLFFILPRQIHPFLLPYKGAVLEECLNKLRPFVDTYAENFYQIFFDEHPEARTLFGKHMSQGDLYRSINNFMLFLADNTQNPRVFIPFFEKLGKRHKMYGVQRYQLEWVIETNIKTLKRILGSEWKDSYEKEWRQAYRWGLKIVIAGGEF